MYICCIYQQTSHFSFSAVNVTGCRQAMYNNKTKYKRPRLKKMPGDAKRKKSRPSTRVRVRVRVWVWVWVHGPSKTHMRYLTFGHTHKRCLNATTHKIHRRGHQNGKSCNLHDIFILSAIFCCATKNSDLNCVFFRLYSNIIGLVIYKPLFSDNIEVINRLVPKPRKCKLRC